MKFNLKNKPVDCKDRLTSCPDCCHLVKKVNQKWFEGFEKELREMIDEFKKGERQQYDINMAEFIKEEILGE